MQIETTITDELMQWGWWVQACPSRSLSYPSSQPFTPIKGGASLTITDDRAVEIDQAIAYLFGGDEQAIKAIKLRFVCGFGYRDIGKRLEISKDRAQRLVDDSVSWLNGYFVGVRTAQDAA